VNLSVCPICALEQVKRISFSRQLLFCQNEIYFNENLPRVSLSTGIFICKNVRLLVRLPSRAMRTNGLRAEAVPVVRKANVRMSAEILKLKNTGFAFACGYVPLLLVSILVATKFKSSLNSSGLNSVF
jgi:hypothetical protein